MEYIPTHITTNTTTEVCSRPCVLHSVTLNEDLTGSVTINNGDNAIAVLATGADHTPVTLIYDVVCDVDLEIVTAGSDDITISHRPL